MDPSLPGQQKYCDTTCRRRKLERNAYARKKMMETGVLPDRVPAALSRDGRGSARRGPAYEKWVADGWPAAIASGVLSQSEAAAATGTSSTNVARWQVAFEEDELARARQAAWSPSAEALAALEDFEAFRARYFLTPQGAPYLTEPFHKRWIGAILRAMSSGGRQMILSPPRHGKSDLLTHFCVWLICRNPNVRIMWIGGNDDIAKLAVGMVLDTLENNVRLREDVLGPGRSFQPPTRSGRSWSSEKFTVSTRDLTGLRSPTMVAIGKGAKLLSRDADLIVADDIQDEKAVWSPSTREKDNHWWTTQVVSRKEAHTALVVIGSRQHHEDLYGRLLQNSAWSERTIVESAHSPECTLPVHPIRDGHSSDCPDCALHVDCMLFPAVRPMSYVQDMRAEHNNDATFEMVYDNVTRPSGEQYVTRDQIEPCKNLDRRTGRWLDLCDADGRRLRDVQIPAGRLIAGLDPAVRGVQAAVLWAVDVTSQRRFLLDLDARRAGGLPGARSIIEGWHDLYGCAFWVIERNNYQEAILQDRDILDFTSRNGIHLEPSYTDGFNKWNKDFGVTKQLSLFRADPPLIDLPWGDEETRAKVRQIIDQWVNFEPSTGRMSRPGRGGLQGHGDLLMAAWLPEATIRRWRIEEMNRVSVDYDQTDFPVSGLADSYAGIAS